MTSERESLAKFPPGTRVRLVRCDDPYTHIKAGTTGTVAYVDALGTVHVDWDNGIKLGMCLDVDNIVYEHESLIDARD